MDNVEYTGYNGEPIIKMYFLDGLMKDLMENYYRLEMKKSQKDMLGLFLQIGHKIILKQLGHKLNMIFLILQ